MIPAGRERVRANDTLFRFRPGTDFAYLMGAGEPGALLVLEPDGARHSTLLFVRAHNRGKAEFFTDRANGELWVGRHRGVDESALVLRRRRLPPAAKPPPHISRISPPRARSGWCCAAPTRR